MKNLPIPLCPHFQPSHLHIIYLFVQTPLCYRLGVGPCGRCCYSTRGKKPLGASKLHCFVTFFESTYVAFTHVKSATLPVLVVPSIFQLLPWPCIYIFYCLQTLEYFPWLALLNQVWKDLAPPILLFDKYLGIGNIDRSAYPLVSDLVLDFAVEPFTFVIWYVWRCLSWSVWQRLYLGTVCR